VQHRKEKSAGDKSIQNFEPDLTDTLSDILPPELNAITSLYSGNLTSNNPKIQRQLDVQGEELLKD
jgi:hypothetical protein